MLAEIDKWRFAQAHGEEHDVLISSHLIGSAKHFRANQSSGLL
ncbi:hypothetical protein RESH_00574 [Rhodopirellula europaea SH398]|jgi:hypothetical protein|uniref:Uncharacterized protein n=1 Tax=Rhodopirellula europaea SH398 TaxID=1263868 RepID=M5SBK0_9BACT|nr:hypothetical protein RESH_00574 [Rhodopirellula europaea SH398]